VSDFSDGAAMANQLRDIADRMDRHELSHADHELDDGAHAAAFDAHNQSPGVVEEAEQLAEDIIETAVETADAAIEGVQDAGSEVLAAVEAAAETPADIIDDVVTPEAEESEPVSEGERAPAARTHLLHRKVW